MHAQPRRHDGRFAAVPRSEAAMTLPVTPSPPDRPASGQTPVEKAEKAYKDWRSAVGEVARNQGDSAFDTAPKGRYFSDWKPVGPQGEPGFEAEIPSPTGRATAYVDAAGRVSTDEDPLTQGLSESACKDEGMKHPVEILEDLLNDGTMPNPYLDGGGGA